MGKSKPGNNASGSGRLPLIFAGATVIWIGAMLAAAAGAHLWIQYMAAEAPVQPVRFSHTVHVNGLNMECLYCHVYAETSIHATIPEGSVCLDCHEGAGIEHPEVERMLDILEKEGSIPWQRVYRVKDHVYFSHRVHTAGAGLRCQECHGPVEHMTVAEMSSGAAAVRNTIEMGWCIACHRRLGASRECITCHK